MDQIRWDCIVCGKLLNDKETYSITYCKTINGSHYSMFDTYCYECYPKHESIEGD
jgi:hypothetical protein